MKKALSIWCFPGGTGVQDAMRAAKRAGFDGIELALGEDGELSPSTSDADAAKIRQAAADIGLEISSFASGLGWKYPLIGDDAGARAKAMDLTRHALRLAKALGADCVLSVPGTVNEAVPYDEAYARCVATYKELGPDAEAAGVYLGIENVWNKFLLSPLEMARIVDEIKMPYVGAFFDVGNVLVNGFPQQWIRILGRRIRKVHIKDFKTSIGNIQGFTTLLNGDVNWPAVVEALKEIGYDGYLVAEVGPPNKTFPEHLIEDTSRAMTKILSL
jgi:L-ribulose-5-phosphate 3-epimerase